MFLVVFALVLLIVNFYSATCTNIYGNIFKVNTHSFNATPQLVLHTISVFRIFKFDSWLWPFSQLFDYSFLYSYRLYRYKYCRHIL